MTGDGVQRSDAELGEGPVWDRDARRLAGRVQALDPATGAGAIRRHGPDGEPLAGSVSAIDAAVDDPPTWRFAG